MPGTRIKAGSGDGEIAVVMMVHSGNGGVVGDGTCANDDNDRDGDDGGGENFGASPASDSSL